MYAVRINPECVWVYRIYAMLIRDGVTSEVVYDIPLKLTCPLQPLANPSLANTLNAPAICSSCHLRYSSVAAGTGMRCLRIRNDGDEVLAEVLKVGCVVFDTSGWLCRLLVFTVVTIVDILIDVQCRRHHRTILNNSQCTFDVYRQT